MLITRFARGEGDSQIDFLLEPANPGSHPALAGTRRAREKGGRYKFLYGVLLVFGRAFVSGQTVEWRVRLLGGCDEHSYSQTRIYGWIRVLVWAVGVDERDKDLGHKESNLLLSHQRMR